MIQAARSWQDLMTGYNLAWQFKYEVTALDIAIPSDCGIKVKPKK